MKNKRLTTYYVGWHDMSILNSNPEIALTPSQAKYKWFKSIDSDYRYSEVFKYIKVFHQKKVNPYDFFGDQCSFDRMKEHRSLDFAYMGMKVDVSGKTGVIVGNYGFNLMVFFDGSTNPHSNCHPHWETTYFDLKGNIVADYKK